MAAINEKRVNWRKVALERGEENNSLRARVLELEAALEKCGEAFEFLARYYFPDGTEARDLVKQALKH